MDKQIKLMQEMLQMMQKQIQQQKTEEKCKEETKGSLPIEKISDLNAHEPDVREIREKVEKEKERSEAEERFKKVKEESALTEDLKKIKKEKKKIDEQVAKEKKEEEMEEKAWKEDPGKMMKEWRKGRKEMTDKEFQEEVERCEKAAKEAKDRYKEAHEASKKIDEQIAKEKAEKLEQVVAVQPTRPLAPISPKKPSEGKPAEKPIDQVISLTSGCPSDAADKKPVVLAIPPELTKTIEELRKEVAKVSDQCSTIKFDADHRAIATSRAPIAEGKRPVAMPKLPPTLSFTSPLILSSTGGRPIGKVTTESAKISVSFAYSETKAGKVIAKVRAFGSGMDLSIADGCNVEVPVQGKSEMVCFTASDRTKHGKQKTSHVKVASRCAYCGEDATVSADHLDAVLKIDETYKNAVKHFEAAYESPFMAVISTFSPILEKLRIQKSVAVTTLVDIQNGDGIITKTGILRACKCGYITVEVPMCSACGILSRIHPVKFTMPVCIATPKNEARDVEEMSYDEAHKVPTCCRGSSDPDSLLRKALMF
jgi:chemotaxis protein histidine kinase CheA